MMGLLRLMMAGGVGCLCFLALGCNREGPIKAYQAPKEPAHVHRDRIEWKTPADWIILPELISREFLGSYCRQGDERWSILVKWVHYAMLEAEVLGITQANIDEIKASATNPEVRGFLGLENDYGKFLGADNDWAYRIIKAVGNYGENYDKYFGPLELPRGWNNLYTKGGLQYPLAWR